MLTNLPNRGELDSNTEMALENMNSQMKVTWLTQHNEDGTHNLPTSAIPTLDASKIATGVFSTTLIPPAQNRIVATTVILFNGFSSVLIDYLAVITIGILDIRGDSVVSIRA